MNSSGARPPSLPDFQSAGSTCVDICFTGAGNSAGSSSETDRGGTSSNVVPSTDPLRSAVQQASGVVLSNNFSTDEQGGSVPSVMTASFDVL